MSTTTTGIDDHVPTRPTREFVPEKLSLRALQHAAQGCRGCALYANATQTVFGEGPKSASVMLIGEQPGDQEDRRGRPFVGPAGRTLEKALHSAGIDRKQTYVTNVVKHFKHVVRGKARIHQKPDVREIRACRPWLDGELETVRPEVVVLLGATAAKAMLGSSFRVTRDHGALVEVEWAPAALATWHPSNILRAPDGASRHRLFDELVADLATARSATSLD